MKTSIHVEVEPLSEQRWARIERSLMERVELEATDLAAPTERSALYRRYAWIAGVAAAAVFAVVFTLRLAPTDAIPGQPSRIATGDSASHLVLPGLTLDVERESAVVVGGETPDGMLLVLDRGSIVCRVAPRAKDSPMIVQAGATSVRVVGTRFRVARRAETAQVHVYEGVVEVTFSGRTWRVGAGEQWPAGEITALPTNDSDSLPTAEAQDSTRDTDSQDASRNEPSAALKAVPSRRRSASQPPTKSQKNADGARPSAARRSRPAEETKAAEKATPEDLDSVKSERRKSNASGSEGEDPSAEESSLTKPSSQAIFEQATTLERSNPGRAAQLYRKLESGNDSWARNALYARGRLEASRGNRGEARRLLELYLTRFPNGSNAEDARAVLRRLR